MKNIKSLLMLAAITVASMTFVSCDVSGSAFIPCIIEKSSNS